MTQSKLSDSEKLDVVRLYREPGETTSTLAERYGVSSTTIRRALKSNLPQEEYTALTNQKQIARWQGVASENQPLHEQEPSHDVVSVDTSDSTSATQETTTQQELSLGQPSTSTRRLRKRSSSAPTPAFDPAENINNMTLTTDSSMGLEDKLNVEPAALDTDAVQSYESEEPTADLKEFLEEELDEELDSGLDELNDEDFDDELEPLPLETLDERTSYVKNQVRPEGLVNVLPLSEASIPKTCYLVVDRSAELIARPLKEFGDLGQLPLKEIQEKTLPVFDNHRVARRFSNRSQRVIKIPDGDMLQKACSQLHAKGITRLLINGQVYSL